MRLSKRLVVVHAQPIPQEFDFTGDFRADIASISLGVFALPERFDDEDVIPAVDFFVELKHQRIPAITAELSEAIPFLDESVQFQSALRYVRKHRNVRGSSDANDDDRKSSAVAPSSSEPDLGRKSGSGVRCYLAMLDLTGNRITTIEHLGTQVIVDSLLSLNLSRNMIKSLAGLSKLSNLLVLNLSNNRIGTIRGLKSLSSLTSLDLSMNRIEHIQNIGTLRSLRVLTLYGNEIKIVQGLEKLGELHQLFLQRNVIENAQHIMFLKSLDTLDLSFNKLADLTMVAPFVAALPNLKVLQMRNNPLCEHPHYRMMLLENENITMLDGLEIKSFIRQQLAGLRKDGKIDELVAKITHEYLERIKAERGKVQVFLQALQTQMRRLESEFDQYQSEMQNELDETLRYLQRLRSGDDAQLVQWFRSEEGIAAWSEKLKELEHERRAKMAEIKDAERRVVQDDLFSRARMTNFAQQMYSISMQRPQLWRAIKDQQLIQKRSIEEQRQEDMRYEREEVEHELSSAIDQSDGTASSVEQLRDQQRDSKAWREQNTQELLHESIAHTQVLSHLARAQQDETEQQLQLLSQMKLRREIALHAQESSNHASSSSSSDETEHTSASDV